MYLKGRICQISAFGWKRVCFWTNIWIKLWILQIWSSNETWKGAVLKKNRSSACYGILKVLYV